MQRANIVLPEELWSTGRVVPGHHHRDLGSWVFLSSCSSLDFVLIWVSGPPVSWFPVPCPLLPFPVYPSQTLAQRSDLSLSIHNFDSPTTAWIFIARFCFWQSHQLLLLPSLGWFFLSFSCFQRVWLQLMSAWGWIAQKSQAAHSLLQMQFLFPIPCVATIKPGYSGNATEVLNSIWKVGSTLWLEILETGLCSSSEKKLKEMNLHQVEERTKWSNMFPWGIEIILHYCSCTVWREQMYIDFLFPPFHLICHYWLRTKGN